MAIPSKLDEGIGLSYIEERCVLGGLIRLIGIHDIYKVRLEEGFDHILIADGVPVIDKSKLEKFLEKIAKEFTRKGAAIKPSDISVAWNGKTRNSVG